MPRLIALTGFPRSGKDTLADEFVSREGFVKVAIAEPLYREVSDAFQVPVADLQSHDWKTRPHKALSALHCQNRDFRELVTRELGLFEDEPMTSRFVLQKWGTEFRRKRMGRDYWTSKMIGTLRGLDGKEVIIPDMREDHEALMAYWMVNKGWYGSVKILQVRKLDAVSARHSSDEGLSKFVIDGYVDNEGTVEELYENAVLALEKARGKR